MRKPALSLAAASRYRLGPALAIAPEAPVAHNEGGVVARCFGDAEAAAGNALVVPKALVLEVGDGGVREEYLARREAARCSRASDTGGGAKEGDLESVAPRRRVERAGHVPPFDARVEVGAEVTGKDQVPG